MSLRGWVRVTKKSGKGKIKNSEEEGETLIQRAGSLLFRSRRRLATVLAVVIAVFLGYHVIFGQNGVTIYQQKRLEDRTLKQEIIELQAQNAARKAHVERLNYSQDAIEHEAREKLHYLRPGEVIYTLNEKARNEKAAEGDGRPSEGAPSANSAPLDAAAAAPKP